MDLKQLLSHSPTLALRRALLSDQQGVIAFLSEQLAEFNLKLDFEGIDRDLNDIENAYSDGYFGLIEKDGKIAGTFALFPLTGNIAEIRKMYLSPHLRGEGLGAGLLGFMERTAIDLGYSRIEVETFSPMTTAIHLYISRGYKEMQVTGHGDRCDHRYYKELRSLED